LEDLIETCATGLVKGFWAHPGFKEGLRTVSLRLSQLPRLLSLTARGGALHWSVLVTEGATNAIGRATTQDAPSAKNIAWRTPERTQAGRREEEI